MDPWNCMGPATLLIEKYLRYREGGESSEISPKTGKYLTVSSMNSEKENESWKRVIFLRLFISFSISHIISYFCLRDRFIMYEINHERLAKSARLWQDERKLCITILKGETTRWLEYNNWILEERSGARCSLGLRLSPLTTITDVIDSTAL